MELEVIAEGVESDAQRQFLLAEGCEMGQGFHFWRPLTANDIASLYAVKVEGIAGPES